MPLLDDLTGTLKNLYGNGGAGDPLISIGMGLLSQRGVGRGLAAGFQNAAAMSQVANERQQQDLRNKLLTAQVAKSFGPEYQYGTNAQGQNVYWDKRNPNAGQQLIPGQSATSGQHWAQPNELPEGYKGPAPFMDAKGMPHFPPAAGATVNMPPTQGAFEKQTGEDLAKRFGGLSTEGDKAQEELALLSRMRGYGTSFDTGWAANFRNEAAKWGVKLGDNIGPIEAYGAIIDKMAPMQRVPGSGAQSDFELKNFKNSLPNLIRTPEGNALVMDTLEGMAKFKMDRAVIAERAQMGELSPQEALKAIRALPNPMEKFNKVVGSVESNPGNAAPAASAAAASPTGNKKLGPMPQDILLQAKEALAARPEMKKEIMNRLIKNGFDPSGL